jgi:threonine dehydrogenase-like Zn-dependent dehydrogenase
MRRNAESLRRVITHRFALEDVARAFATADDKSSGAIKVQVASL